MKIFTYSKASGTAAQAIQEATNKTDSAYIAGGTNLIDLMKDMVLTPAHLVDINGLNMSSVTKLDGGGVRIGALARNSDVANHPLIRENYPVLSRALLSGASPQLRNMATTGGNLLQRTRCSYFYDTASACNKRTPGTGCDAIDGYNRMHAVLGGSAKCIAVNPSDMNVALAALDANVFVSSGSGERKIRFVDFHKLPGNTPHIETVLEPHELITAIELPAAGFNKNWCYLKVRDRASYAFALVSAAVCLQMDGSRIKEARLALGGVGTKPWRASDVEKMLVGKTADEKLFKNIADMAMKSAKGYEHNKFKIEMGKRTIVRALKVAAGGVA
ncbi:MAG: xanthine dehydrogenase family protein subunit M [Candidatus Obscuribacterales bacterium]|nr:xanthine dehydrogenase family protein subunit M [Candidatus Obscuribacterales bacterium]